MRYFAEPAGHPPTEHDSFTAAITVLRTPGRAYSVDDNSHEHTILVRDDDGYLHRP